MLGGLHGGHADVIFIYYIVIDISLQATYGECDLEREGVTGSGWFTENPREIQKMSV